MSNVDKDIALLKEVLGTIPVSGFEFTVERHIDAEFGVVKVVAQWKMPLDEVRGDEYSSKTIIELIEPN